MVTPEQIEHWRGVLQRLQRGPAPRGEQFELCREVLVAAPGTPEGREAARLLLEGAMADATTSIADAQDVMRLLKALSSGALDLTQLLDPR
ncbi:MAG TPA: hypothetical protein VI700_05345 [Thermoanaerobaculaceae bacterium]|nr:hypothetical protein [Thermoanaerobaculaceae bacterium]